MIGIDDYRKFQPITTSEDIKRREETTNRLLSTILTDWLVVHIAKPNLVPMFETGTVNKASFEFNHIFVLHKFFGHCPLIKLRRKDAINLVTFTEVQQTGLH